VYPTSFTTFTWNVQDHIIDTSCKNRSLFSSSESFGSSEFGEENEFEKKARKREEKKKRRKLTGDLLEGNIKGSMLIDKILIKENTLKDCGRASRSKRTLNSELFDGIKQQKSRNRDFYWEITTLKEGSRKEERKWSQTHVGVQESGIRDGDMRWSWQESGLRIKQNDFFEGTQNEHTWAPSGRIAHNRLRDRQLLLQNFLHFIGPPSLTKSNNGDHGASDQKQTQNADDNAGNRTFSRKIRTRPKEQRKRRDLPLPRPAWLSPLLAAVVTETRVPWGS